MKVRKIVWVLRLPQIDPPFAEDQRERDGCMMLPISFPYRLLRQVRPDHHLRDCCYHHRLDLHRVAFTTVRLHREIATRRLPDDEVDEFVLRELQETQLTANEQSTAHHMLTEGCGIQLWRPEGERRWTYIEGRHRARALIDAGVRRAVVFLDDERLDIG